jgi:aspartyl-tRNA synthetase
MALPVTDQLITQMMKENVRTQPTTPMEGNVSRPMIVSDLLSAMKDVNFSQLMTEYGTNRPEYRINVKYCVKDYAILHQSDMNLLYNDLQ